ncbi:MAG: sigma-70 family RNA polymerase sigma factor, partial [Gemmataceae bacterium]|nr:sigma-70 family RNA polymerase sigma factor [Gemmataceae bacterium]
APDAALLDRLARGPDPLAFAELVARHGPAVWAVCRRLGRCEADAEDAFQATFLVLARDPRRVRKAASVGSWLYGVAARVGRAARRRRSPDPARVTPPAAAPDPAAGPSWAEVRAALDEELAALPDVLRAPLLLCYLAGKTQDEAAAELGWKVRTVKARVARGRDLLRRRLTRRGVGLPAALAVPLLDGGIGSAVPPRLFDRLTAAPSGRPGAGASAAAWELAKAEASTMTAFRAAVLATSAAGLLAAGSLVGGAGGLGNDPPKSNDAPPAAAAVEPDPPPPGALARIGTTRFRTGGWHQRVFFTADGNTLVATGQGKAIDLWDPRTGRRVGDIPMPKSGFDGAAYHHPSDTLALIGHLWPDREGGEPVPTVWLVDVRRRKVARTLRLDDERRSNYLRVAFTPDGKRLVTAVHGELRVWDVRTGDELLRQSAKTGMDAFAVSPDGKRVAFGRYDLYLWDWETGEEPRKFAPVGSFGTEAIAFGPGGKTLYVVTPGRRVDVLDVPSGRLVGSLGAVPAEQLALSPDGKTLAVTHLKLVYDDGSSRAVGLWDTATGKETGRLSAGRSEVRSVSWSADGTRLAGVADYRLWAWDVKTDRPLGPPGPPGHEADIRDLTFAPDGRLFTASDDGTVRSWDPATGAAGLTLQQASYVGGVAVSPDVRLVAGSGLHDDLRVWDARTGEERFKLLGNGWLGGPRVVRFTPDGRRLVAWGGYDEFVRVWDMRTGKLLTEHTTHPGGKGPDPNDPHGDEIGRRERSMEAAVVSPDGGTLGIASFEGVRLIDTATGKDRPGPKLDDTVLTQLAFSPDGKRLAVARRAKPVETKLPDGRTRNSTEDRHPVGVYELATGKQVWEAEAEGYWSAHIGFSPDGTKVAETAFGRENRRSLRVWDAAAGKDLGRVDLPDGGRVFAFSPDGKRVAVAFGDTTAAVYDLATSLKPAGK